MRVPHEAHYVGVNDLLAAEHAASGDGSCCIACCAEIILWVSIDLTVGRSSCLCLVDDSHSVKSSSHTVNWVKVFANTGPDVGVGSREVPRNHNVGERHQIPKRDCAVPWVPEIDNDPHSGVLVFKCDLIDDERVVGVGAAGLEAGEGEAVAEHVNGCKFGQS